MRLSVLLVIVLVIALAPRPVVAVSQAVVQAVLRVLEHLVEANAA